MGSDGLWGSGPRQAQETWTPQWEAGSGGACGLSSRWHPRGTCQSWLWVWGVFRNGALAQDWRCAEEVTVSQGYRGAVLSGRSGFMQWGRARNRGRRPGRGQGSGWRTGPGLWAGVAGTGHCQAARQAQFSSTMGPPYVHHGASHQGAFRGGRTWLEPPDFGVTLHASQRGEWGEGTEEAAPRVPSALPANWDHGGILGICRAKGTVGKERCPRGELLQGAAGFGVTRRAVP